MSYLVTRFPLQIFLLQAFCFTFCKLSSSPVDELGEGAYESGGVKLNASLEQGVLVSTATQRAETTTRHHHTEKPQLLKPTTTP